MSGTPKTALSQGNSNTPRPEFHGYTDIVDYILGITFEIWEQRKIETILDYYGEHIDVFSMESITHGAARMVEQTYATLDAYPDRLLLAEDVVWSGNLARGFSSHRLTSPMTNLGDTLFGPATGRKIRIMNVADCEITDGQITREWLLRDNLALATQLGADLAETVSRIADRFDEPLVNWLRREFSRTREGAATAQPPIGESTPDPHHEFARKVLENCWADGDESELARAYAPFAFMQRAPIRILSGHEEIFGHYADWRCAIPDARLSVDHLCSQETGLNSHSVAVRWSVAGALEGSVAGSAGAGRPVYLVGVTHWKMLNGRIVAEWTVFDELSLAAQALCAAI